MTTVVLVHGAFHGAWCWEPVRSALDERGVANLAPELPLTGLDTDASTVAAMLDAVDGPVVLCGHSYGGMVISRAASGRDDVDRLVYLCAVQIADDDEMTTTMRPTLLMEHMVRGDGGAMDAAVALTFVIPPGNDGGDAESSEHRGTKNRDVLGHRRTPLSGEWPRYTPQRKREQAHAPT